MEWKTQMAGYVLQHGKNVEKISRHSSYDYAGMKNVSFVLFCQLLSHAQGTLSCREHDLPHKIYVKTV